MRTRMLVFAVTVLFLLLIPAVPSYGAQSTDPSIVVNGKLQAKQGIVIKDGTMLVPFRSFVESLGASVNYELDGDYGSSYPALSVRMHDEMSKKTKFLVGDDAQLYFHKTKYRLGDDGNYHAIYGDRASNLPYYDIKGRIYVSIRDIGAVLDHSVVYNKKTNRVDVTRYGLNEDEAIKKMVDSYIHNTDSVDSYFSKKAKKMFPYPKAFHSEVMNTNYKISIDEISYLSAAGNEAVVELYNYADSDMLTDALRVYRLFLVKESSGWKIINDNIVKSDRTVRLNVDLDSAAEEVLNTKKKEAERVIEGFRTYIKARGKGDVETVLQYTSPALMKEWELYNGRSYKEMLLEVGDRWIGTGEGRVLYVGEKYALVYDNLIYDTLFKMEFVDNRWTYVSDIYLY